MRFARFNLVGGLGLGVQLSVVAGLVHGFGADPVLATAAGIVAALLHNFTWHVRWTWRDRMGPGVSRAAAFARFVSANGLVSLAGSMALMPVLLRFGLPVVPANLVAIGACGLANYWLAAAVCFTSPLDVRAPGGTRI
ncbi:MAG TPA: GtrA family protein [Vicinamibacterales bacterium]|nr:GtrA family protein [Vicinamibacterales bacterium]